MDDGFQIQFTATAQSAYTRYCREAESSTAKGDVSSPKVKMFRTLEEALTKDIPSDPFNQKFALAGCLSSIFRFAKESLRICYAGLAPQQRIVVLYICEAGPAEADSYARLVYMIMSGKFDDTFISLGLDPPNRSVLNASPTSVN